MAIALVINVSKASPNTVNATTAGVDTSGANLIVVGIASYVTGSVSLTDSKSNTWTQLTQYTNGTVTVNLFYCKAPTVGSGHTFTATASYATVYMHAFSGADTSSPYENQTGVATTAALIAPGSITPAADGEVLVTIHNYFTDSATSSINSSFTQTDALIFAGTNMASAMAYKIQTAAAAVNPTWSISPANYDPHAATMACFKAAAAAVKNGWPWWSMFGSPL